MRSIIIALLGIGLITTIIMLGQKQNTQGEKSMPLAYEELPIIRSMGDIALHANQLVYIEGTYEQQDVRMRKENPSQLYEGHAGIRLSDNYVVFLYPPYDDKAIRDESERKQFSGKSVRVKGTVKPNIPEKGTTLRAPCLTSVDEIVTID